MYVFINFLHWISCLFGTFPCNSRCLRDEIDSGTNMSPSCTYLMWLSWWRVLLQRQTRGRDGVNQRSRRGREWSGNAMTWKQWDSLEVSLFVARRRRRWGVCSSSGISDNWDILQKKTSLFHKTIPTKSLRADSMLYLIIMTHWCWTQNVPCLCIALRQRNETKRQKNV